MKPPAHAIPWFNVACLSLATGLTACGSDGKSRDSTPEVGAGDVKPIERDGKYALEFGATSFEVDPNLGGRITRFAAAGDDVLMPLSDLGSWVNGGSTFWTSPQASWGWPPPDAVDRAAYRATLEGNSIVLTSAEARVGAATVVVEKRFWAESADEALGIAYTVTNVGDEVTLAGWEISRVAANGVTFYTGSPPRALGTSNLPSTEEASGAFWMDHAAQSAEGKLGADGDAGFIAYASDRLLFVKTFDDVKDADVASGEAELELYVKPGEYVEVEQQSRVRMLAPGESLKYVLHWYVRAMDPSVDVAVGSASLLAFAKSVAGLP